MDTFPEAPLEGLMHSTVLADIRRPVLAVPLPNLHENEPPDGNPSPITISIVLPASGPRDGYADIMLHG